MYKPIAFVVAGALAVNGAAQTSNLSTTSVDVPQPTEGFALPIIYLGEEGR